MKRYLQNCMALIVLSQSAAAAWAQESSTPEEATTDTVETVPLEHAPNAATSGSLPPPSGLPEHGSRLPGRAHAGPRQPLYCYPSPMTAAAITRSEGVREHKGLFLRAAIGLGLGVTKSSNNNLAQGGSDTKLSGLTREWSVAVGGAVSRSVVIYGEYMNTRLLDDEAHPEGLSLEPLVQASGLGVGLVYYLPKIFFVSATGLLETISVREGQFGSSSGTQRTLGAALALKLGAEVWATDQVALGGYVGLHTFSSSLGGDDDSGQGPWRQTAITMGLTAVLN